MVKLEINYISKFPPTIGTDSSLFPDRKTKRERWTLIKSKIPEIRILFEYFNVREVQVRWNKNNFH